MESSSSITHLSLPKRVPGHELMVQWFKPDQVPAAYRLVRAEADLGEDMGQDEVGSEAHLASLLTYSHSFSVSDTHQGALRAVIMLTPSAFSRMNEPVLVDVMIVCDVAIKAAILQALVNVGSDLTTQLGYWGVVQNAYRTSRLVALLHAEGFTVVGCVPSSGNLTHHGWTDSFILYKQLNPSNSKSYCCISTSIPQQSPTTFVDPMVHYKIQRPCLTYLPCTYTLSSADTVILRYMAEGDYRPVYDMYKGASQKGQGFSKDEFDTFENFLYYVVKHGHPFIVEDPITNQLLAAFTLTPGTIFRSVYPKGTDAFLIVDPRCHNRQLGTEVSCILTRFCKDLGYSGACGDSLIKNLAMLRIVRNQGFSIIGCIPKAAIGVDQALEDVAIFYKSLEDTSNHIAKL